MGATAGIGRQPASTPAWWPEILVALVASAVSVLPVALGAGFPDSHEHLASFWRVTFTLDAMRTGHFLPVVAPADNAGFGSPFPAIYHRLFLWPAAGFSFLFSSCKAGVLLAQALFSVIGGVGMAVLAGALGASRLGRLAAPVILIFANYTVTNWLVRSAFAEDSALLLIPWVLLWFVLLAEDGRARWWIGPAVATLYFAHSAFAYVATTIIIAGSLPVLLPRARRLATVRNCGALLIGAAIFACTVLPQVYVSTRFWPGVYMDYLTSDFRPLNNAQDFVRYFWDSGYRWGGPDLPYTVQLDSFVLAGLVCSVIGLAAVWRTPLHRSGLLVVALPVALAMALQLRSAMWVYDVIPGFAYLQFSWRLLALVTPAMIAVSIGVAGSLARSRPVMANLVVMAMACGTVVTSGIFANSDVRVWPTATVNGRPPTDLIMYLEYLPRLPGLDAHEARAALIGWRDDPNPICKSVFEGLDPHSDRAYSIECSAATVLRLPVLAAGVQTITVPQGVEVLDGTPEEPRLGLRLPAGETRITTEVPSFGDILLNGLPRAATRTVVTVPAPPRMAAILN